MPSVDSTPGAPQPFLSKAGKAKLQLALDGFAEKIPGCFLFVGSGDEVLFGGLSGQFDKTEQGPSPRLADDKTIFWFASTTKLLAALQLIEQGVLSFDTPVSTYLPQVKPPYNIISGVDPSTCLPVYEQCNEVVTVSHLMRQISGQGDEFGEKIRAWKAQTKVGGGFTNSCQKVNLLSVPPTEKPGRLFQYGNSSEWLGILIQEATGKDLDDVFREQIFDPLGMKSTTFYPFSPDQRKDLMPLRWHNQPGTAEKEWVELTDQQPILTLPRSREEIEYPVAGGGIYTAPADYHRLLRHILKAYTTSSASVELNLSAESIASLFKPSLPEGAHAGWSDYFVQKYRVSSPKELDWSTGLAIYNGAEEQMGGWGRSRGSAGWSGAPGIEYYIDPVRKVVFLVGSNMLPMRDPLVEHFKTTMEKLVNEVLQFE
ncbi:hypothetical protein JCM8097_007079 [Rhodosporidiobolus ruineniae]